MTTHTPGPWHIGMNPGPIIYGPKGEQVANMLPCMLERDEHNANVCLITAAPALLEALRCIVAALKQPVQFTAVATDINSLQAQIRILRGDCKFVLDTANRALSDANEQSKS